MSCANSSVQADSDVHITFEDQQKINKFARLNAKLDDLKVEILPAYCNWFLIDNLKYDQKNSTFVEPYLPNHKIGIIHLAGKTADQYRFNKNNLVVSLCLYYRCFNRLAADW